jgi:nicotinamide riboside transporter PnuC
LGDILSWIVTFVGLLGFWLAGRKIWWAWYINIANQLAWVAFALITEYYAFLLGTAFYLVVFVRNAYLWTKNRNVKPDVYVPFAQLDRMDFYSDGPSQFQASSYGYPRVRVGEQIYYKE